MPEPVVFLIVTAIFAGIGTVGFIVLWSLYKLVYRIIHWKTDQNIPDSFITHPHNLYTRSI